MPSRVTQLLCRRAGWGHLFRRGRRQPAPESTWPFWKHLTRLHWKHRGACLCQFQGPLPQAPRGLLPSPEAPALWCPQPCTHPPLTPGTTGCSPPWEPRLPEPGFPDYMGKIPRWTKAPPAPCSQPTFCQAVRAEPEAAPPRQHPSSLPWRICPAWVPGTLHGRAFQAAAMPQGKTCSPEVV